MKNIKKTLETIFFCRQYDAEFIESANDLGLADYFTELDLDDCDIQEAYDNTYAVCKHANIQIFLSLMSYLPYQFGLAD